MFALHACRSYCGCLVLPCGDYMLELFFMLELSLYVRIANVLVIRVARLKLI